MNPSLFWRLVTSSLLVIVVSCGTMYLVGQAISPGLLDFHLGEVQEATGALSDTMRADLEADLEAAQTRALQRALLWGVVISIVIAGAISMWISARIARPIWQMQRSSKRIASGHYHARLSTRAPGEVSELADSFNEMAAALMNSERRRIDLLADVTHEFRTPLSSLRGYLEGVADELFEADAETLDACNRQIGRLEKLVADISLLSRVEAEQERLTLQPTSVSALLEQVVSTFTPRFQQKGVGLTLGPVPPSVWVQADSLRTGQVLANLVENALRHTGPNGRVSLSANTLGSKAVKFHVTDSGEGVSEEDLPHLFTRFYRGGGARAQDGSGTGIGLTLVKSYVEQQGGSVGVESRPGEGSSFWFTLPKVAAQGSP